MSYPIEPSRTDFDDNPWLELMWENYDALCSFWEKFALPPQLEGDDIFQTLVETWLVKFPETVNFSVAFVRVCGMRMALNEQRSREGQRVDSEGEPLPYVYVNADDNHLTVSLQEETIWYVEDSASNKDELIHRLSACTEEQQRLLILNVVGGYTPQELSKLIGKTDRQVRRILDAAKKAASTWK